MGVERFKIFGPTFQLTRILRGPTFQQNQSTHPSPHTSPPPPPNQYLNSENPPLPRLTPHPPSRTRKFLTLRSDFLYSERNQSAIYFLLVISILSFKSVEYMHRARGFGESWTLHFGHIQSTFYQLLITSVLCLKSVKNMDRAQTHISKKLYCQLVRCTIWAQGYKTFSSQFS